MSSTALAACIVTIIAWGSAGIFDKLGVKGIDPFSAVLVRMVFGTAGILVVCAVTGRVRPVFDFAPSTFAYLALSALLGGLIGQIAYFAAIKIAPASQIVPFTAAYPVVAFILAAVVLREHPTAPRILGVVLVVVGLMLVSSGNHAKASDESAAVVAVSVEDIPGAAAGGGELD